MLPLAHRLTASSDFRRVMRAGVKSGSPFVVAHVRGRDLETLDSFSGMRVGLVVSKAVGNAVVRHRISRRLRHICRELPSLEESNSDVVIRALPAVVTADHSELQREVLRCVRSAEARYFRRRVEDNTMRNG